MLLGGQRQYGLKLVWGFYTWPVIWESNPRPLDLRSNAVTFCKLSYQLRSTLSFHIGYIIIFWLYFLITELLHWLESHVCLMLPCWFHFYLHIIGLDIAIFSHYRTIILTSPICVYYVTEFNRRLYTNNNNYATIFQSSDNIDNHRVNIINILTWTLWPYAAMHDQLTIMSFYSVSEQFNTFCFIFKAFVININCLFSKWKRQRLKITQKMDKYTYGFLYCIFSHLLVVTETETKQI